MPKKTLLDLTQAILDSMGSDEVNSIDDTEEAYTIAKIVRDTYYELLGSRLWPTHAELIRLTPSADEDYPTHMKLEDDVIEIHQVFYNIKEQTSNATGSDDYKEITYLEPMDFIRLVMRRDASASNIETVIDNLVGNGTRLLIDNDKFPDYWTSFDDTYLIFDSYDDTYDDTLQSQKTMVWAVVEPPFTLSDTFIPDIPTKAFPYLLEEAKSTAYVEVRQAENPKAEQKSRRQRSYLAREKHRTKGGLKTTTYGRK